MNRTERRQPVSCTRCGTSRRLYQAAQAGWNFDTRTGQITAIICTACQTAGENTEAAINDATLDYRLDADGLLRGTPKGDLK